jgi:hypothetical protein
METIKNIYKHKTELEKQISRMPQHEQIAVMTVYKTAFKLMQIFGLPGRAGLTLCLYEHLLLQETKNMVSKDDVN